MRHGLPEIPVLSSQWGTVEARHYNQIRRLFVRRGAPQEIVLGARGLMVHLDRSAWICYDRNLNDYPLIAWTDFDDARRPGLHSPIRCRVLQYHAYGRVIGGTVVAEVDRRLAEMLRDRPASSRRSVIPFRGCQP